MESTNLQPQHQLQEQFTGYYSSLLSQTADGRKAASTNDLNPAASIILNINNNNYSNHLCDCNIPNSWMRWPPVNSMIHHGTSNFNQQSAAANEFLLPKTEEDLPNYFSKLSEMMDSRTTTSNLEESSHLDLLSKYKYQFSQELVENHCPLSSFSSAHHITDSNAQNPATLEIPSTHSRYTFSHTLPSINISTSEYLCSSVVSSSLDLTLQAADLLSSATYDGATSSPSNSCNKTPTLEDGLGKKRRPNSIPRSKNIVAEAKKNRSAVPRPSFPLLKVRKEKLGDRIAALQRMVAPYGKTDTASVLTEAIGYIQFLHDRVQTLSVPYMRSSNSKPTRTMLARSSEGDGKGQPKRDLKTRGLCLVPVSCVPFFNTCNDGI